MLITDKGKPQTARVRGAWPAVGDMNGVWPGAMGAEMSDLEHRMHGVGLAPSAWVTRCARLVRRGARVLDLACGGGRHACWLAGQGLRVVAVDRDADVLGGLAGVEGVDPRCLDLEAGDWPLKGERFDAVVVTNYLFRPRFDDLLDSLAPGGVLIYETFMVGNERFGRPARPEFLLRPGELLDRVREGFTVVAFEQGIVSRPREAAVQRVCAVKSSGALLALPGA